MSVLQKEGTPMSYDLKDYVDVKTRIGELYKRHPDARIIFEFMGTMPGNPAHIWGIAKVYRSADDLLPTTGTCSELAEGKTSFTRGSELANLETSAVGRALGMMGIGIENSLATMQEVVAAEARQDKAYKTYPTPSGIKSEEVIPAPTDEFGPICDHGEVRVWKSGNKNGKPWGAWMCADLGGDKCAPLWRN